MGRDGRLSRTQAARDTDAKLVDLGAYAEGFQLFRVLYLQADVDGEGPVVFTFATESPDLSRGALTVAADADTREPLGWGETTTPGIVRDGLARRYASKVVARVRGGWVSQRALRPVTRQSTEAPRALAGLPAAPGRSGAAYRAVRREFRSCGPGVRRPGVCRLFAMTGGGEPVEASFWLLEAPDSLSVQSRREPDGTGLGVFDPDGTPRVDKWPIAAYADRAFAEDARHVSSTTFLAHIRYASTGAVERVNTHPFEQQGRLFAHNGVVEDVDLLDDELGEHRALVAGDTDSERIFALITKHIEANGGDVTAGLVAACQWIAGHLPVYALNLVLTTPQGLWALRYPGTHRLYVLDRPAGGSRGDRHLDAASAAGAVRVRSGHLSARPAVIIASEPMDADPGWRLMAPGELVHIDADLHIDSQVVIDHPPARLLTLADLRPQAAASQHPTQ